MGLFGTSSPFDSDVEKATSENNVTEDWSLILEVCDKAGKTPEDAKNCLRSIVKRLNNPDPHIAIQAAILLDACVSNCGKSFHTEVASREFETEFTKLIKKCHHTVTQKLKDSLKKWAEGEFKTDQQLNLIPSLYVKLKNSGTDFTTEMPVKKTVTLSKDPNVVQSQEEEDQIAKAIELSLKETSSSPRSKAAETMSSSLYPVANLGATSLASVSNAAAKELRKVRALYDFEAAEDNELTFNTGEIVFVIDDSDPNWWRGSNQRGEGLFPANFVTADLSAEPENLSVLDKSKKVQFNDDVDVKPADKEPEDVEINEEKIDRLLHLLHEADPTNPGQDSEEMLKLEREVNGMGPLIDTELERVDRKHAQLTQLSSDLVEALSLYHTLMREPQYPPISKIAYGYPVSSPQAPSSMVYNGGATGPTSASNPYMGPYMTAATHDRTYLPQGPQRMNFPPHMPMAGTFPHQTGPVFPPGMPLPPGLAAQAGIPASVMPPGMQSLPPQSLDDQRMPPGRFPQQGILYGPPGIPSGFPPNAGPPLTHSNQNNGNPAPPTGHFPSTNSHIM